MKNHYNFRVTVMKEIYAPLLHHMVNFQLSDDY